MEDRLYKFSRLVDVGSYTKAAELLHISQPALSVAMSKLEKELGAKLMEQKGRVIKLTRAGKFAYDAAKELKGRSDLLKLQLSAISSEKPTLSVGMIDSVGDVLFSNEEALAVLERDVTLSISVHNSTELITAVEIGELDAAFVTSQLLPLKDQLVSTTVGSEKLVLVCAPAIQARSTSNLNEGTIKQFLSYNQSSTSFQLIRQRLLEVNLKIEPIFYSTSPEILLKMTLAGRGVAVLPEFMVHEHLDRYELIRLPLSRQSEILRPITAIHQRSSLVLPPLEQLIRQVSKLLKS